MPDNEVKSIFFEAIGLTDGKPYARLNPSEAIQQVLRNAHITHNDIGVAMKIKGDNKRALPQGLIKSVVQPDSKKRPDIALRLGEIVAPLLRKKIREGEIDPDDFTPISKDHEISESQKKTFYDTLKFPQSAVRCYKNLSALEVVQYFTHMLYDNYGLPLKQIGEKMRPPQNHSYMSARIGGSVALDGIFMRRFAVAIRPYLEHGIEEKWLDGHTFTPKPVPLILASALPKLPADFSDGDNVELLKQYAAAAHVPLVAIGPMIGNSSNWIFNAPVSLYPRQAAIIATKMAPYAKGKEWDGVLEVTDTEELLKHQCLKHYLVQKIEEKAGKCLPLRRFDKQHETFGPFLSATRTMFDNPPLSQGDFGEATQTVISAYECNRIPLNYVKDETDITEGLRKTLDTIAEVLGEAYLNQKPGKSARQGGWRQTVTAPSASQDTSRRH